MDIYLRLTAEEAIYNSIKEHVLNENFKELDNMLSINYMNYSYNIKREIINTVTKYNCVNVINYLLDTESLLTIEEYLYFGAKYDNTRVIQKLIDNNLINNTIDYSDIYNLCYQENSINVIRVFILNGFLPKNKNIINWLTAQQNIGLLEILMDKYSHNIDLFKEAFDISIETKNQGLIDIFMDKHFETSNSLIACIKIGNIELFNKLYKNVLLIDINVLIECIKQNQIRLFDELLPKIYNNDINLLIETCIEVKNKHILYKLIKNKNIDVLDKGILKAVEMNDKEIFDMLTYNKTLNIILKKDIIYKAFEYNILWVKYLNLIDNNEFSKIVNKCIILSINKGNIEILKELPVEYFNNYSNNIILANIPYEKKMMLFDLFGYGNIKIDIKTLNKLFELEDNKLIIYIIQTSEPDIEFLFGLAAKYDNREVMEYLLNNYTFNYLKGVNYLVKNNNLYIINLILDKGYKDDIFNNEIFIESIINERKDIVKLFMNENYDISGLDLTGINKDIFNLIHEKLDMKTYKNEIYDLAASVGNMKIINMLKKDIYNHGNALIKAAESNKLEVYNILYKLSGENDILRSLYYAIENDSYIIAKYIILNDPNIIYKLIDMFGMILSKHDRILFFLINENIITELNENYIKSAIFFKNIYSINIINMKRSDLMNPEYIRGETDQRLKRIITV